MRYYQLKLKKNNIQDAHLTLIPIKEII